jgi:hypothetical protein
MLVAAEARRSYPGAGGAFREALRGRPVVKLLEYSIKLVNMLAAVGFLLAAAFFSREVGSSRREPTGRHLFVNISPTWWPEFGFPSSPRD